MMPFGPYKDHAHCVRVVSHKKNPPRDPHAYCAWLERKISGGDPFVQLFLGNAEILHSLYLSETTGVLSLLTKEHALNIFADPKLVQDDSRDQIVDDHRWLHAWAKAKNPPLSKTRLNRLHSIYVKEFQRRGFKHNTPLKIGKFGFTPVIKLLTRKHANALLKEPKLIRKDSDATVIDDHRWVHWWAKAIADKKDVFLTRERLEKLHEIYVDEFNRRGFNHQSPLEFATVKLASPDIQRLLGSRKAFLVDSEFINFVGSSISSKSQPSDIDVLVHGAKTANFNKSYLESLPEELREKVQVIFEPTGPTGPYIPAYELWAMPRKDITQKEPKYRISLLSPFTIPRPSQTRDRSDIFEISEDDYFVVMPPENGVRMTVHRKETEVIAFDEDRELYNLPEKIIDELLAIEEPTAFIVDCFLIKQENDVHLELLDMPWWRDSEHINQSTRVRYNFMFRLSESESIRFAIMHHFENRRDLLEQLKEEDGRYLIIPGSAHYAVDNPSDWFEFDGSDPREIKLAEGSDAKIKELMDSGKWEDMGADARFRLMTKRKTVEPLYPFAQLKTTKKGYSLREVFGIKSVKGLAKEIFQVPNKISTEVKIDGFRAQVHRKGDQVKIFTESGHEITKQLPTIASDTKGIPPKEVVLDGEMTPYGEDFRNLGRAAAAPAFAKGAKKPVDDNLWAFHVFDLLYMNGEDLHNLPYSERRERLKGIELPVRDAPNSKSDFKIHLWENKVHISTSADQMVKDASIASKVAGSEGAMFKQWDSKYRLSGNTPLWSKMKTMYEIDVMVIGTAHKDSAFNYICAIGPVTEVEDAESAPLTSAKGKKFVRYKGKTYSVIGKTFTTKLKAKIGQILRVSVKTINRIDDKVYHWFHPQVLEAREDKVTPDPLTTAETIMRTETGQPTKTGSWDIINGELVVKGGCLLESYLIRARFGMESPLDYAYAPWVAVPTPGIKKVHKNCKNFKDGMCTLKNKAVKADDPACPDFAPLQKTQAADWTYLQNNEEVIKKLKELKVGLLIGQGISRDLLDNLLDAEMKFQLSGAETILDVRCRPLMTMEPELPLKTGLNVSALRKFYNTTRSKSLPDTKLLLASDPYLTYPDESKTWRFVLQYHIRGLSVHGDFRMEISKTQLIGWTWNVGKSLIKPMLRRLNPSTLSKVSLTKEQVKNMTISEVSAKLNSTKEGKILRKKLSKKTQDLSMAQLKVMCNELWNEDLEPILKDPTKKILTQRKAPEPHEWLTYSGEVPAGAVGATAELEGQFIIMDSGTVEFGTQKSYYHEYFLHGNKLKGRFFVRRITTRAGWRIKEAFAWLSFRGKEGEKPYVLSNRAVKQGWIPPRGVSALPKTVRAEIPENRQYWRAKNAKAIRDALVDDMKKNKVTIKLAKGLQFAVKRVWHKGPEVKRGAPVVRYWILIHDGKKVLDAWNFGKDLDPLEEDGIIVRRHSGKGLDDLIQTTGELPATHPASLTKKLKNQHDTGDKGSIQIIADSNTLLRARFNGGKLKGLYVFMKESPGGDIWIFKKSELPAPKKLLLSSPKVIHLGAADMKTEIIGDLLIVSGVGIKPGEVIGMDGKPVYFTAEGIKKFWPSMLRQPIVAVHGELKGDVIGFVNKIHYDERGWGVIDQGVVWHPLGIKLILEKKLPDWSIEVLPETIWEPVRKHDLVIGGRCIGLSAVPKGACATCHIETATIGAIKVSPGQVYKFGMLLEDYMSAKYWGSLGAPVTTQSLADELGRPRSTIEMWMKQAGIPRRGYVEAQSQRKVRDEQVRKYGGRASITALGTGAFTDIPRDDCPQCKEARAGGKSKRNFTATLFSIGADHLLINAPKGIGGMLAMKKVKPKYVLLEHIHEDVVGGLHELRALKPIVFATKPVWDYLRRHYLGISKQKGDFKDIYSFKRYLIKPSKSFKLSSFVIKPIMVQHAKPGDPAALGFKVDIGGKVVWHCSDVYRIPDYKKMLKGVDIFIGDGASLTREIAQKRGAKTAYGHTSIEKQIKWAKDADIPRIYFTQIGHIGKTHEELNKTLHDLSPNAQALFDGAQISLGGSAPGAMHSKKTALELAEGKRGMIVRTKPYSEYAKQAIYLLDDEGDVLGLYVEGYPEGPYDAEKIRKEKHEEHGLSNEEWKQLIGDAKSVWIYNPRILQRYEPFKNYSLPKTKGPFIHDVNLEL